MFHQISKHGKEGSKNEMQLSFFSQLRSVWIYDKTLFRVLDIASQSINNSWRNSKQKFTEFYDNKNIISVFISLVCHHELLMNLSFGERNILQFFLSIFFSFYFLNALQSDNNSNAVYVLGHKYILGPSQGSL